MADEDKNTEIKYEQEDQLKPCIKNRDSFVDIAKGLGIILVVADHCRFSVLWGINPYVFLMPFFFILSGFFIRVESDIRTFIFDKFRKLIAPFTKYFVFYVILVLLLNNSEIKTFKGFTVSKIFKFSFLRDMYLNSELINVMTPLWFVVALFLGFVMISLCKEFILALSSSKIRGGIAIVILSVVMTLMLPLGPKNIWTPNVLIGALFRSLYVAFFLFVGHVFYKYKTLFLNIRFCIFSSIIFYVIYALYPSGYMMAHGKYLGELQKCGFSMFILKGILGSYIIFVISHIIDKFKFLSQVFVYLGRKSFHIMALHLLGFIILDVIILHFAGRSFSLIENAYVQVSGTKKWMYFLIGIFFPIVCCFVYDWLTKRKIIRKMN